MAGFKNTYQDGNTLLAGNTTDVSLAYENGNYDPTQIEAFDQTAEIEKRNEKINQINKDASEINQLAKEINIQVVISDEKLDKVNGNLDTADKNMEGAVEELVVADKLSRKNNCKLIWITVSITILVLTIVMLCVWWFVLRHGPPHENNMKDGGQGGNSNQNGNGGQEGNSTHRILMGQNEGGHALRMLSSFIGFLD